MDDMPIKLASLRLAPVQATSWGHPTTSGLPSIDYFLSSELMEPPNADEHNTERLIRLPNLSVYYTPPDAPHLTLTRADIGVRPDEVMYWCCQNLIKYLPQYDDIFPQIAERVRSCRFVFIRYGYGTAVTAIFQSRLKAAFARHNLSAEKHCIFLPKMDYGRFTAVARLADVFLDAIEWSGCNSALESLVWNIPPVVQLGQMMRGRHAATMMAMMGIAETTANSIGEYVEIAVRLGTDPGFRQTVSGRIAAHRPKLFRDRESIRGLEDLPLSSSPKPAARLS
jgi:protein O-GlcNAc transferase